MADQISDQDIHLLKKNLHYLGHELLDEIIRNGQIRQYAQGFEILTVGD